MHVVWVGRGWGFIPCFSLTLSPFSFTLRPCVRLGMRAWCAPLAPSFVFLTYLFAFSLFPHGPWPPHTFCALFFFVVYLAVLGTYGGVWGIYGYGLCLWACLMTCVVVRLSFLRAALSLGRPPSQHTWFSLLRMCSGGYDPQTHIPPAGTSNRLGCLGLQHRVKAAHPGGVVEQWLTLCNPSAAQGH